MHPMIQKTLGGLSPQYYFRQLFFGSLIFALMIFVVSQGTSATPISGWIFFVVCTLLYPYSRFVYESIIDFIMGDNVIVGNFFFMMFVKTMTMLLCWVFSIFIAPVGLAYLYFHHSRLAR